MPRVCTRFAAKALRSGSTVPLASRENAAGLRAPTVTWRRNLRVLTLAWVVAPLLAAMAACGVSDMLGTPVDDGGTDDDATVEISANCPKSVSANATCMAPEGTTCPADSCGFAYFVCTKRRWEEHAGGAFYTCPAFAPTTDAPCGCVPKSAVCTYNCTDSGNGDGTAFFCVLGRWRPTIAFCGTPIDGGTDDAGDATISDATTSESGP